MEYRELFQQMRKHPGMWGLDGSYGQFCAFLRGCDEGNARSLLIGFREWLVVQFKGSHRPDNVDWSSLILWLAFPECWRPTPLWADERIAVYTLDLPVGTQTEPVETWPDRHVNDHAKRAVDMLFDLLDAFWEQREQFRGLTKIFAEYAAWLESEPATASSPEKIAQHIQARLANDEVPPSPPGELP
ncbi:MAG TPA: hypothetical protein VFV38_06625 [Ktedonobacteraceae bacterium]|nr:hypothetical protein [Ktedonobacteraceae bacterium]